MKSWLWRGKRHSEFDVGTRVIVRQDADFGPWPGEPTGRIVACPDGARFAEVTTAAGQERSCVAFDEPQMDADGDGPYRESQVLQRYLDPAE